MTYIRQIRISVFLVVAGAALSLSPIARGQSYSGTHSLSTSCGPSESGPISVSCGTDQRQQTSHCFSSCVSAPESRLAMDHTTSWSRSMAPGLLEGSARSDVVSFNAPCGGSTTGWTGVMLVLAADDLVFYRRNDPTQAGTSEASMNIEFRGGLTQGPSCGSSSWTQFTVCAGVHDTSGGACDLNTTLRLGGSGPASSGPLAGYPNDDSLMPITVPLVTQALNNPTTVRLSLHVEIHPRNCNQSTTYDSHGTLSLPACGPVFNLPPGITCRSAQLNIVDNVWMGPTCCTINCCDVDFDDGSGIGMPDGGLGIEDLLYYLVRYDGGCGRADVDDGSGLGMPDGGIGIEDLLYYLTRYDAGC